jgi:hypothetical protein
MRIATLALLVCCLAVACAPAFAADARQFTISPVKADAPPRLDGTLDDPGWKKAQHLTLAWDFQFQRPAREETDVYLLYDDQFFYLGFFAHQSEEIVATQHTNGVGEESDDYVGARFWPDGVSGFGYRFVANPLGTHYQESTENAAFTPRWTSVGRIVPGGYTVTMAIPIAIMRGSSKGAWRAQFVRYHLRTQERYDWAHVGGSSSSDPTFAGYLDDLQLARRTARPKARIGVYGLGEFSPPSLDGATSRVGADVSLPITATTSFVGTFHPDFSNVESDQQSISPTEFVRSFNEVRPFFTQGASFYNRLNCNNCINWRPLYTPNIPTPRDGYAIEGTEGQFSLAGFDAVGDARNDAAQALGYGTKDNRYSAFVEHIGVDTPGFHDSTQVGQLIGGNNHNFNTYLTYADEVGTNVTDRAQATWKEAGVNYYGAKDGLFAALHENGPQYSPADGFTEHPDIKGYSVFGFREIDFKPTSAIQSVTLNQSLDCYHNTAGRINQYDVGSSLLLTTRTQFTYNVTAGIDTLMLPDGSVQYFNQNGIGIDYRSGTANATGSAFNWGRYVNGYLHSLFSNTSLPVMRRGSLHLEADNTFFRPDQGAVNSQWLERASFSYQLGLDSSVSLGVRRIIGTGPPFSSFPTFTNASNVSFAYHKTLRYNELYVVYGDPSQLFTKPALYLKLIHYIGADKGT